MNLYFATAIIALVSIFAFSCTNDNEELIVLSEDDIVTIERSAHLQRQSRFAACVEDSGFNMPIVCDSLTMFEKSNTLPDNHSMHTFLVNRDNKVLIVGMPIFNDKH